jgi:hypothetical protein
MALTILFYSPSTLLAVSSEKILETRYADVHYAQDTDLDDFVWKLGGTRSDRSQDDRLASNRIDRLVERVCAILDMWPKNFKILIDLRRGALELNNVAYYDGRTRTLTVRVDYASDGVLAHEIAHAVIDQSSPSVPSKVKEILSQYVDAHLWSDYS